jgi:hypothetical protein
MKIAGTTVVTSSWSKIKKIPEDERPTAVRISVGLPRFWKGANKLPNIVELAPFGLFNRGLTEEEFADGYRKRLSEFGVSKIRAQLKEVAAAAPTDTIALCCYEDVTKEPCHRTVFAEWWREQTGQQIEEFVAPNEQATMV